MLAKAYLYSWFVIGATFVLVFVSGNMTALALVIFGFIAFGMVFAGMMNVLPGTIADAHHAAKPEPVPTEPSRGPVVSVPIPRGARSVRV
jgi:hypothetical protein